MDQSAAAEVELVKRSHLSANSGGDWPDLWRHETQGEGSKVTGARPDRVVSVIS